jgi:hypothetical protein
MKPVKALAPLNLTCTTTACLLGQHYYGPKRRKYSPYEPGSCRTCGVELVDWQRVYEHQVADSAYVFGMLQTECWRHHWWHCDFDPRALAHASKKGKAALAEDIVRRLQTKGFRTKTAWDGRQTPKTGNVLFYAQHATGTCCRDCIQYWHGVPNDRPLNVDESNYLGSLVMQYIDGRLPDLAEDGVRRTRRSLTSEMISV